ncbi:MAG: AraC family transcriptional regulator [Clostridia bacterium]|nr:AraC family transcriptional regulator [Clostridia bacterium]
MDNTSAGYFEPPYENHAYNVYLVYDDDVAKKAHFHPRFEFLYMVEGECEAIIDGKSCIRKAGDIVVVNPFETHYNRRRSEKMWLYTVSVDELYLADFYRLYGKKQIDFDPKKDLGESGEKIRSYLEQWRWNTDRRDVLSNQGWINLILAELVKVYGVRTPIVGKINGAEILKYIQEHYSEDLTMEKVARRFGYAKEYFSRIFNRLVGVHFRTYLNKLRLDSARVLLKDKTRKVTDVIAEVGFSNAVMYYRAVKKFGKESDAEEVNTIP